MRVDPNQNQFPWKEKPPGSPYSSTLKKRRHLSSFVLAKTSRLHKWYASSSAITLPTTAFHMAPLSQTAVVRMPLQWSTLLLRVALVAQRGVMTHN